MKFYNIRLLFVIFVLICSCISHTFAQDSDGAAGPASKRIALRRPVGKAVKATTTTTTTAPPAYDDEGDYQDGEHSDGAEHAAEEDEHDAAAASTTTTSTEAPKKVGPVIRPFRSNDDFLNSLKRRQMNAKKHRAEVPVKPKSKVVESSSDDHAEESAPAAAPVIAPTKGYKGNAALSRRKPIKPTKPEPPVEDADAEETENQKEESKLKRPGRPNLALRKRN